MVPTCLTYLASHYVPWLDGSATHVTLSVPRKTSHPPWLASASSATPITDWRLIPSHSGPADGSCVAHDVRGSPYCFRSTPKPVQMLARIPPISGPGDTFFCLPWRCSCLVTFWCCSHRLAVPPSLRLSVPPPLHPPRSLHLTSFSTRMHIG